MKINIALLNAIQRGPRKDEAAQSQPGLVSQWKLCLVGLFRVGLTLRAKELAAVIASLAAWAHSKQQDNRMVYAVRDIVQVDLGCGFGYELSYRHPAIVLHDGGQFCLVVPCSTGKYGKNSRYIINGTPEDGFSTNTGVPLDGLRTVSKTRISHKVGQVSVSFLDRLNAAILREFLPVQHHRLTQATKSS